jgi:hypothetical protein
MNDFNALFRERGYGHIFYLAALSALMQCVIELSKIMFFKENTGFVEIDRCRGSDLKDPSKQKQFMTVLNIIKELKCQIPEAEAQHIKYVMLSSEDCYMLAVTHVKNKDYVILISPEMLEKEFTHCEWKAMIAHEMGHIIHHDVDDTFTNNYLLAMLSLRILFFNMIFLLNSIPELMERKPTQILELIVAIGVISVCIHKNLALSQYFIQKEIRADKKSVAITHDHEALITGLQKLEHYQNLYDACLQFFGVPPAPKPLENLTPHFMFVNEDRYQNTRQRLKTYVDFSLQMKKMFTGWFVVATHPQNEERFKKLNSYSYPKLIGKKVINAGSSVHRSLFS